MAIVNHSKVMSGLIKTIRTIVGDRLSTLKSAPNSDVTLASVIKDRAKGPRPDFPYIVIDRTETAKTQGAWLRHEEVVKVGDDYKVQYKTEQSLSLSITCYGDDADDILNELRVNLVDDYTRFQLNLITGVVFQACTDTDETPIFIETDFIDGASMDINFTAVSDFTPAQSSVIETIKGESTYYGGDDLADTKVLFVDENNPP